MTLDVAHASTTPTYDLGSPNLFINPHPLLHRMRAEDPVYYSPHLHSWILTSYTDIDAAFYDDRLSVVEETKRIDALPLQEQDRFLPLRRSFELWVGRSSEQAHDRFQKILRRGFTPAAVDQMRSSIQGIVNDLVDTAVRRGEMDIVNDIAHPMAMRVVTSLVLDMGPTDTQLLIDRSNDISGLLEMGELDQLIRCQNAVLTLSDYIRERVATQRSEGRRGVLGAFLDARDEGLMTDDEIVANCIMFLVVGYHTTANLLTNGMQLLFEYPEQRAKLARDFSLLPRAIDEMMRFHGPVASVRRLAIKDFHLRGKPIRANQTLLLVITAANRDPAVYPDPDRFDITREDNRHLGFTVGPYSCMGKALARIEAETYFRTMLTRFPNLRPKDSQPDWVAFRPFGRELRTLRVLFD